MECKERVTGAKTEVGIRFNRDIVECKVNQIRAASFGMWSFNRDIVECKVHSFINKRNAYQF